jgi:hypothetical protein
MPANFSGQALLSFFKVRRGFEGQRLTRELQRLHVIFFGVLGVFG